MYGNIATQIKMVEERGTVYKCVECSSTPIGGIECLLYSVRVKMDLKNKGPYFRVHKIRQFLQCTYIYVVCI